MSSTAKARISSRATKLPCKPATSVFAPRGEWHGFRNTGDRPVRAIFGYFGVTSLEQAGYENSS